MAGSGQLFAHGFSFREEKVAYTGGAALETVEDARLRLCCLAVPACCNIPIHMLLLFGRREGRMSLSAALSSALALAAQC
jgi:hypothetical protein